MTRPFQQGFTLGVLGGGQLGKMLLQPAMNFGLRVKVLDPDPDAPCRHHCDEFVHGSLTDRQTVHRFGSSVDLLTIEIENVSVEALEQLEADGKAVHPQSRVIRTIQDKGEQKSFLTCHDLPTAPYRLVDNRSALMSYEGPFPAVQKLRRAGYDGRGVMKLRNPSDLTGGFDAPSVIEEEIDIGKELSVIVARNQAGETKVFPAIEMMFHPDAHLVDYLLSPAVIPLAVERDAEALAERVATGLGIVGLAAVEMFVRRDGSLLVNEIAPRPHNSGHHTIEANVTSQFEQHLRAILGLPLGSTALRSPAVMVNILGAEGFEGVARYEGIEEVLAIEGASLHLYGKRRTKPFRKMGHVTILDETIHDALSKAQRIQQRIRVIA